MSAQGITSDVGTIAKEEKGAAADVAASLVVAWQSNSVESKDKQSDSRECTTSAWLGVTGLYVGETVRLDCLSSGVTELVSEPCNSTAKLS